MFLETIASVGRNLGVSIDRCSYVILAFQENVLADISLIMVFLLSGTTAENFGKDNMFVIFIICLTLSLRLLSSNFYTAPSYPTF